MKKEILFSVTRKDCEWSYFSGTGPGGQAKNKSRNAVRVYHRLSGARGTSQESRSKSDNEKLAFERMAKTDTFNKWARVEAARVTGKLKQIEEKVEYEMKHNTKVEVFHNGKWRDWNEVEADPNTIEKDEDHE